MKTLALEEMWEHYAKLLSRLSRPDYDPVIKLVVSGDANDGKCENEWHGMVRVIIRLKDLGISTGKLQQVLPLLRARPDLVNILGEAVLIAQRDRLSSFIGELSPVAANRYEPLALGCRHARHGLVIIPPSRGESSHQLAFTVHCSAIWEVLDLEMRRAALEGAADQT